MIRRPPRSTLFPYTTSSDLSASTPAGPLSSSTVRCSDHATSSARSEEHTSELQSLRHLVCRLLLEKKKKIQKNDNAQTNTHASRNIMTTRTNGHPTREYTLQ